MSDADLEAIRQARLQQLREQGGGGGGAGEEGSQEDKQKAAEAEARASILGQILTPEAMERLGRIRMVKESRATDVENRLIMLARSGRLKAKITEDQLKDMLGQLSEQQEKQSQEKIVISRRKGWDDDDDDDLFDL